MRARRLLDELPALTSVSVLGAGFVALGLGYSWFWLVWVVGFVTLVPVSAIVTDALLEAEPTTDTATAGDEAALETLRERYATGAIDEVEFERRLEDLLETETVEEARERVANDRQATAPEPEVERERP